MPIGNTTDGTSVSVMMPFGKYRNWPLNHIPAEYFAGIYSQKTKMEEYPDVKLFIEQNYPELLQATKKAVEPLCPTLKICYIDEEKANKALRLINQDKRRHDKPKRSYLCPLCRYWHHTKKTAENGSKDGEE